MISIRYIGTLCAIVWLAAHFEVSVNGSSAELLFPLADLAAAGLAVLLVALVLRAALVPARRRETLVRAKA